MKHAGAIALAGMLASAAMFGVYDGSVRAIDATKTGLYALDGDTVASGTERWRVANIDAPEIKGRCDSERRLALIAKAWMQELLDKGPVTVERHGTDQYGRALVRLSARGVDLGEALIAARLARPWDGRRHSWCAEHE